MANITLTTDELRNQLDDQLSLLKTYCKVYDEGGILIVKPIAIVIRILMHDTDMSKSLLGQLGLKNRNFYDSCIEEFCSVVENQQTAGGSSGIVSIALNENTKYVPNFDESPKAIFGFVSFDQYWDRVIACDNKGQFFTRKCIVLKVANKDGGAHVSPDIEENYYNLTRNNTVGFKIQNNSGWHDLDGFVFTVLRQIAHEILRTLDVEYQEQSINDFVNDSGIVIGTVMKVLYVPESVIENNEDRILPAKKVKVGVNDLCPCMSGLKYKKCHSKVIQLYKTI
jgi:SEC-C motif